MSNCFLATDDFHSSISTVRKIGDSLTLPNALHPTKLAETNAVCCAMTVLLAGQFEAYLKGVIQEFVEGINQLGKPLSSIPYEMQVQHFLGGAQALEKAIKKDKNTRTTHHSSHLARRLSSLGNTTNYVLAWEAFTNTRSNPGRETVSELLKDLGINDPWRNLNTLHTALGPFDTFLTSFMAMRNVCAHTGGHQTPPSGADIITYVEAFSKLAECIDMALSLRIAEL
jgi:hypothetical protein